MAPRHILSPQSRAALFDPLTEPAAIVRHYTFPADDLALIRLRRRAANRLGFALHLAYLQFPGRVLGADEAPPVEMLAFVASQIECDAADFASYALAVADRFEDWRDDKTKLLESRLREVDALAAAGELPEATLTTEGLSISPIRKNENAEADAMTRRLYGMLPRLRITDLLAEVHGWTGFSERFLHLRSGAPPEDILALMTALLADATNLGLARMARSSTVSTHSKLLWTAEWHVRDETYRAALACLVDAIHAHPFTKVWGDGDTSSSDGQFFRAGGHGEARADHNAKYGSEPGVKFYTHVSDRYPRQNAIAKALREIGRLERTLFTLDWISDPALRRRASAGLNKGEAHHALKRAVFFHRLGEIRDRTFENQSYRASGLNLAVAAIILWNTVYLGRAVDELRATGETIPDELLAHIAPLGWEHIAFNGDYVWPAEPLQNTFRPLRNPRATLLDAA